MIKREADMTYLTKNFASKHIGSLLLVLILSISSFVNAGSIDKTEKYLQAIGIEKSIADMENEMIKMIDQIIAESFLELHPSKEQISSMNQSRDLIIEEIKKSFKWDGVKDSLIAAIKDYHSDHQLELATIFFNSPEGQEILQKMPDISIKISELQQQKMSELEPLIQKNLEKIYNLNTLDPEEDVPLDNID